MFVLAIGIGVLLILGYSYNELQTANDNLLKTNSELNIKISDITTINNKQSASIERLTKLRQDDDKTLLAYMNSNTVLVTQIESINNVKKLKEKEIQDLKRKYLQDHPELKDDPAVELKFFQLSSSIRIESVNNSYCTLFGCSNHE